MGKAVEYYIGKIVDKECTSKIYIEYSWGPYTKKNIFRDNFSVFEKLDEHKYRDIDTSNVLTDVLEKDESGAIEFEENYCIPYAVSDLHIIYKGLYYDEVEEEMKNQVDSINYHEKSRRDSKKKNLCLKFARNK